MCLLVLGLCADGIIKDPYESIGQARLLPFGPLFGDTVSRRKVSMLVQIPGGIRIFGEEYNGFYVSSLSFCELCALC